MSLDIDLVDGSSEVSCTCPCGAAMHTVFEKNVVYSCNITHNLHRMADACGLGVLWDAAYVGPASDLAEKLDLGLAELRKDPDKYKTYNASHRWGTYPDFVRFCDNLRHACKQYPTAGVCISK